jgi:bacillithiol system protein YtxJ
MNTKDLCPSFNILARPRGQMSKCYFSNPYRALRGTLEEISTIEELNRLIEESSERPVMLFKHSLTCPISARAFNEFQFYLNQADPRVSYNLIIVQVARAVSNKAAALLNLEHESPQAILVWQGREIWNASHSAITASSLAKAVQSVNSEAL